MDLKEAITKRHTVRKFLDKPLQESDIKLIEGRITGLNNKYGLSLKLVVNNKGGIAAGWKLVAKNAVNYIILAGENTEESREKIGYCSSDLMLYIQTLGLNT